MKRHKNYKGQEMAFLVVIILVMLINEYIRTIEVKKPKGRQSLSTSPSIADVKINSDYHKTSIKQGGGGGGVRVLKKGKNRKLWCLNINNINDN